MTKLHKLLISMLAVMILTLSLFLVACTNDGQSGDGDGKDTSSYTSDELEASAAYGAFYKPTGKIGDVIPYYSDGTYYILYTREDSNLRTMRLLETTDLISYDDKGDVFGASGISGETMLGGGCIAEYQGEQYLFYTATNDGKRPSVRVAVSGDGLKSFTRKQSFVLDHSQFGFEKGFFDPDIKYDEDKDRFVGVLSTYYGGRAALAFFYFNPTLDAECAELVDIVYVDNRGFDALRSPSVFKLNGKWYISYYAEDGNLIGSDVALAGSGGKMYYLTSDEMTQGYAECGIPLDSSVYCKGKVIDGYQTLMIGKTLEREANGGYAYGKGANIEAHSVFGTPDGLLLSYPQGYDKRFSAPVALEKSSVKIENSDPVVLANEVQEYRLSAAIKTDAATQKFGFIFGYGGDNIKLTINPVFGNIKLYCGNNVVATGYISIKSGTVYNVDIFVEGSNYVMYIDGVAFTFRARNTGNKKIAAFVDGGTLELDGIAMLAVGDKAEGAVVATRETVDRGAAIKIKETGGYRFVATATQEDIADCDLVMDIDGAEINRKAFCDGKCEIEVAFTAQKGSVITASVEFAREVTDYTVKLALYDGSYCQSNIMPHGECVAGGMYALGVDMDADREDVAFSGDSFGATQGTNGFIYTIGNAVDEMMPMRSYSSEGDGAYTDERASGLVVTPMSIETTSDCMAGVTYIVANDGKITLSVGLQPESEDDKVLALLYHNRIRLAECIVELPEEGPTFMQYDLPVKSGDRISLAVRAVGNNSAKTLYGIEVEKYKEKEKLNTNFIDEFYTDKAEANNWVYGYSKNYDFGNNTFEFTALNNFVDGAWCDDAVPDIEIKNGWILTENNSCDAAVGYKTESSGSYIVKIDFVGTNEVQTRICARVVVVGSDGSTRSADFIGDGANRSEWHVQRSVSTEANDTVYIILFRDERGMGYYQGSLDVTVAEV